ncbi:MAG: hypothetical protein AAF202_09055, partial [Pseudomonadota bacterium]
MRFNLTILLFLCVFGLSGFAQDSPEQSQDNPKPTSVVGREGETVIKQFVSPPFEDLSEDRKLFIYYLSQAIEASNDIIWMQASRKGLEIREFLQELWKHRDDFEPKQVEALEFYLVKLYSNHGNYDFFANERIPVPEELKASGIANMITAIKALGGEEKDGLFAELDALTPYLYDDSLYPKFVVGDESKELDLVADTATNFYGEGVTLAMMDALPTPLRNDFLNKPVLADEGTKQRGNEVVETPEGLIEIRKPRIGDLYSDQLSLVDHYLEKAREFAN